MRAGGLLRDIASSVALLALVAGLLLALALVLPPLDLRLPPPR